MEFYSTWSFVTGFFHNIVFLRLLYVVASSSTSFLFYGQIIFHCRMWRVLFICSSISSWTFRFFPLLAIINNAFVNIHVQVFVWVYVSNSHRHISRSEIPGSHGKLVSKVSPPFHIPASSTPIAPHPHQHLLLSMFDLAMLVDVKWHLTVVWVCISLVTRDIEHLFKCLFAIYISSLENCLLGLFAPYLLIS